MTAQTLDFQISDELRGDLRGWRSRALAAGVVGTVLSAIGVSQQGRSPQQLVAAALRNIYAGAQPAYAIPGAEVGYNSAAYGAVYDILVDPGTGQAVPSRLVIIAAVRKNVAVEVVGFGPVRPASPESFDQPNPSLLGISQTLDEILNTVTWAGDPPL